MKQTSPADSFEQELSRFFLERLQPEVLAVQARKRVALIRSIAVGFIIFPLFAGLMHYFTSPHYEMMGQHGITFWPLLLLLPASMGVIGFSLTYIQSLRLAVEAFRTALMGRLAEFIDPGAACDSGKTMADGEFADSRFFGDSGKIRGGKELFCGRSGSARYEFCEIRWEQMIEDGREKTGKNGKVLKGIFFTARFDRRFREAMLILPGAALKSPIPVLTEALLARHSRPGLNLFLSKKDDKLVLALLGEDAESGGAELFDKFNFSSCRDFCREARLCIEIARVLACDATLWQ